MVILIPVYNPRERIINYVKKLKEKNYDVVVINDGSDENYHAVFVRYTKSPSALHWAEGNFFPFCMQIHG